MSNFSTALVPVNTTADEDQSNTQSHFNKFKENIMNITIPIVESETLTKVTNKAQELIEKTKESVVAFAQKTKKLSIRYTNITLDAMQRWNYKARVQIQGFLVSWAELAERNRLVRLITRAAIIMGGVVLATTVLYLAITTAIYAAAYTVVAFIWLLGLFGLGMSIDAAILMYLTLCFVYGWIIGTGIGTWLINVFG